jgi:hypothetical protein
MPNWKLVDRDTRVELAIGDERTTFRNDPVRIDSLQAPDEPGSTGRVYVRFGDGSKSSTLFPGVVNAEFIDIDGGRLGTGESAYSWREFKIPAAWRGHKITLDEAEDIIARHAGKAGAKYDQAIAEKWKRMKRQIDPELSLWTFSTPSEDWIDRTGMLGIALFRHDEFLSHVTLVWD